MHICDKLPGSGRGALRLCLTRILRRITKVAVASVPCTFAFKLLPVCWWATAAAAMAVQITRAAAGPVFASSVDGSCFSKQRYAYVVDSCAGFAELSPDHVLLDDELFDAISNVPGALRVERQGNGFASRYTEQKMFVWSELPVRDNMEFAIMRNQRTTVMFKDPPGKLHAEAWRILRAVVKGKELLPGYVHQYMKESLARRRAAYAPGSASAAAAEGFSAVAPAPGPGIAATGVLPRAGHAEDVCMAEGATAPISPCGPTPPKKHKFSLWAAEAAHGVYLPCGPNPPKKYKSGHRVPARFGGRMAIRMKPVRAVAHSATDSWGRVAPQALLPELW